MWNTPQVTVLDNGLTVVTVENDSQLVEVELCFRAGHLDDEIPGTAHYLEHLMCEGPDNDSRRRDHLPLIVHGSEMNAQTGLSFTRYYWKGLATFWEEMTRSLLATTFDATADSFERERFTVLEEIRKEAMGQRITDWFRSKVYPHIPLLQNPSVGTEESVKSISLEDIRRFYEKWYGAQNAALIVVGGIKHEQVLAVAGKMTLLSGKKNGLHKHQPVYVKGIFQEMENINPHMVLYFPRSTIWEERIKMRTILAMLRDCDMGLAYQRLRNQERLIYGISLDAGGILLPHMGLIVPARSEHFEKIETIIFEEIDRIIAKKYDPNLLRMIVNCFRISAIKDREFTSHGEVLDNARTSWLWSLPYTETKKQEDLVATFTPEILSEAAKEHFRRERYGCLHFIPKS